MRIETKYRLIEKLIQTEDDAILSQIQGILEGIDNPVVGSRPDGNPITKQDIIERAEKSEEAIKEGNVYLHEQVINHFEKRFNSGRI